jgi:dihydroflavonol-4-reductase
MRDRRIEMITLVTGATGLVGNNVVRRLVADEHQVRVLARTTADSRPLADLPQVAIHHGDVRDAESVQRAAEGVDSIVHAAASVHIGWHGMEEARAINVAGTRNVAQAALRANARMVHVSSIDALGVWQGGPPVTEETPIEGGISCPYVVTKRAAEQVLLELVESGLKASIVNPGFMLGPNDWKPSSGKMLLSVARGWGLWVPTGGNCFCDVRDVADGILAALERGQPGRRYILGGENLTYREAWRIFAEVSGGTPPVFPVGPLVRYGAGYVGDIVAKFTRNEPLVNSAATAIAAQKRCFSSDRAKAELGYHARPVREAAADAWAWFKSHGYV